jgi:preprotein translocase SecF subunit
VLCWLNPAIGLPLKPGLDFTGGTQIQIERRCGADCGALTAPQVQEKVAAIRLPAPEGGPSPNLGSAGVQVLDGGRSLTLRLPALDPDQSAAVVDALEGQIGPLEASGTSVSTIGPTLGSQLLRTSIISLLVSFAAIAAYISFSYNGVFAFLALVALAHDVLITCGVFAWLGLLLGIEVDTLFAVSLITVAGYSVNDTVVVYGSFPSPIRWMWRWMPRSPAPCSPPSPPCSPCSAWSSSAVPACSGSRWPSPWASASAAGRASVWHPPCCRCSPADEFSQPITGFRLV